MSRSSQSLVSLFNQLFQKSEKTVLQGGSEEPLYLPADAEYSCHRIIFTRDYSASALHEVAHWCIAGTQRRQHIDYGYWYCPDGRTATQQRSFEQVEIKPQALEWILAKAAGLPFRISADNLNSQEGASKVFKQKVWEQVKRYCAEGLPKHAQKYAGTLAQKENNNEYLSSASYQLDDL